MRITQEQIARIAQVSQATVSRVVAGDPRVEPVLRDRVVAVMEEHNYKPDVRARSLRQKRTYLIGLVVKRPAGGLSDDPFFANLIAGITDTLVGMPYHLCVEMVSSDEDQAVVYDELLRTRRVDGLILVESEARDERIHRLQSEGFPFVLIGNPVNGADEIYSVDNDNVLAGRMATGHLIDLGYKNIAFLGGPEGVTVSEDRIQGYRDAMNEFGLPINVWHSEFGFSNARCATEALFESGERPDALVVLDDYMAMGAILAARTAGLRIPADLGMVSFNDSNLCQLLDSGLTSVSLNIPQLVQTACHTLLNIIEDKQAYGDRRTIIGCELKIRGSSLRTQGGTEGR